jgi:hypothetical protein
MRISTGEIPGLLSGRTTPKSTATKQTGRSDARPSQSGREVARANELNCVVAVAKWGHLRIQELARSVWPLAKYAEQVAARTARRLVKQGLLIERRNALGGRSLCLTRTGVAWLEVRGVESQHTLDLTSVSGPTFFHRTFATRYLIERQNAGQYVAGEYLILRRKLPFKIEALSRALRKLPDGFSWSRLPDGSMAVELIEQEAASKARGELEKCLRAAAYVGTSLPGDKVYKLSAVVFVFDGGLSHARRILLAANSLWGDKPLPERIALEKRVKLVAVELRPPLVWVSQQVMTLHEFRGQPA